MAKISVSKPKNSPDPMNETLSGIPRINRLNGYRLR